MWNKENIIIAFTLPFLIGGLVSSWYALKYMYSLPEFMHQPLDCVYAVFVSFLDIGTTAGLGALVCFSLTSKLKDYLSRVKQTDNS